MNSVEMQKYMPNKMQRQHAALMFELESRLDSEESNHKGELSYHNGCAPSLGMQLKHVQKQISAALTPSNSVVKLGNNCLDDTRFQHEK